MGSNPIADIGFALARNAHSEIALTRVKQKREYTWPGSNWRPSACEADVIATRPQVLLPLVAPALQPGSSPCVFLCRISRPGAKI